MDQCTGARDVTIRGGESGQRFRSITQAIAALTGQGSPAAPLRPLQSESKNKKRSRAGDTDPDGSHGIRFQTAIPKCNQTVRQALSARRSPLLDGGWDMPAVQTWWSLRASLPQERESEGKLQRKGKQSKGLQAPTRKARERHCGWTSPPMARRLSSRHTQSRTGTPSSTRYSARSWPRPRRTSPGSGGGLPTLHTAYCPGHTPQIKYRVPVSL